MRESGDEDWGKRRGRGDYEDKRTSKGDEDKQRGFGLVVAPFLRILP